MSDGFSGDGFTDSGTANNGQPPAPTGMIVVQDATGLANANSYIDIAYLYAFADQVGYQISIAATATTIEQAILRAMRLAETRQAEFFGARSTSTQLTAFPRTGFYADFERTAFIPDEIKRAQAAYALAELSFASASVAGSVHAAAVKKVRKKVGELETETEYAGSSAVLRTDYGIAMAKGDAEIAIIIANSLANSRLSHPLWVGAQ